MKPFLFICMAFLRLIRGTTCWNLLFLGYRLHKMYKPDHKSFRIPCWSRCFFSCSTKDSTQNLWILSCPISWTDIHLSRSEIPQENVSSMKSWCIGCLATIVVRGKRTSDSCSPPLETPWEHYFDEIPVYRLPSNHCGPGKTDLGFVFPTAGNPLGTLFRWNPGVSVA